MKYLGSKWTRPGDGSDIVKGTGGGGGATSRVTPGFCFVLVMFIDHLLRAGHCSMALGPTLLNAHSNSTPSQSRFPLVRMPGQWDPLGFVPSLAPLGEQPWRV